MAVNVSNTRTNELREEQAWMIAHESNERLPHDLPITVMGAPYTVWPSSSSPTPRTTVCWS
jgi:hypothetical protein